MNEKHNTFEKLVRYVTGKGFYFVVLLCVAAIALSGFYLVRNVRDTLGKPEDQPVVASSPTPLPSARPSLTPVTTPSPKPSSTPTPVPSPSATPTPTPSEPVVSEKPAALVFTWPIKGTIISDFSVDTLSYDATMGDWRTHAGLDIAASVGTQVKAVAAGVVRNIYEDDFLGTTVIIDHGNGLTSSYSNLSQVPTVSPGDSISTGDIIGSVGRTAAAEGAQDSHLHLAMTLNDAPINPKSYLPE